MPGPEVKKEKSSGYANQERCVVSPKISENKRRHWPTVADFNLVSSLELSLQELAVSDIIKTAEAVEIDNMLFKQKERMVLKVHTNKIQERSDNRHSEGYCYTYILTNYGSQQIGGSTRRQLIEKLYDFYYSENNKDISFESIRDEYLDWYRVGRAGTSVDVDRKAYSHIKGSKLASKPLSKITYQDIKGFFTDFSKKNVGKYSKSMYDKIRTCIYNMLEYALYEGYRDIRVESFHYPKSVSVCFKQMDQADTWTKDEHDTLLGYLIKQNDVFSLMFLYQLLTGDRFETVSAITPEDVDVDHMMVSIHAHHVQNERGSETPYAVKEGTKGNSSKGRRKLPITKLTLDVLLRAISIMPEGSKYIFEYNGRPVCANTYRNHIHVICKEAGVPYHSPHRARNYAASIVNSGDNISEMCEYFGWADKKMPLRYNRNLGNEDELREKLSKIAGRMFTHG